MDKPLIKLDWEKTLFLIIIVLALATRLWGLGDRVQSHDESIHTKYSWNLYTGQGFQHNPLMHGPFLFEATALSYFFFGDNDFTARLPVALMGVAVVAFPYLLRRWLGRSGALATSFLLLISPSIAYYSRYIRHDIPAILFALVVIYAAFEYLRAGGERRLYLMAGGLALLFASKEVAFIYAAILGVFLVVMFVAQALAREWPHEEWRRMFSIAFVLMAIGMLIVGVGLYLQGGAQVEPVSDAPPQPGPPPVLLYVGIAWAGLSFLAAAYALLSGLGRDLRDYRAFDLIVVLGTLCLPLLSPLLIKVAAGAGKALVDISPAAGNSAFWANLAALDPLQYAPPHIWYSAVILVFVLAASVALGVAWDWRRWSIAAAVYYAIFVVLFTTVFTNGTGIASGLVGSLGYWLAQQAVQRGSQPPYYYLITTTFYEYLPFFLALIASIYIAVRSFAHSSIRSFAHSPFILFLVWWTVLAWAGYSYAGEKMPWLTTHLALPMILLSGWLVGEMIDGVDWRQALERRAWLVALVAPPFFAALVTFAVAASSGPFHGYELPQLEATGQFLGGLVGVLAFGAGLGYLAYRSGYRLAVRLMLLVALLLPVGLTIHTAWNFCYVNYDYPTEFLVYAHAGAAVKDTVQQIEELSRRTVGAPHLIKVAYGSDGSTLWYWQLRNFPNATFYGEHPSREQLDAPVVIAGRDEWDEVAPYMVNDYVVNTYTFLWWPMEDYRNLTWERIHHAITDPQARAALWDIWYARDYRRYDELTGEKHTLDEWPLRSDYRLYIRRDVLSQMWDLGAVNPAEAPSTGDPYADGWQDLSPRQVFGSQGAGPGQFLNPRAVKIGPEGYVYVVDSGNNRIQKFTPAGEFVAAWGQQSQVETESGAPQGFLEPWGAAVAPDGSVYVADTWNHRIQKFDSDGNPLTYWGLFGQYGLDDPAGQGAFYGPRDLAVGPDGNVYVADTGNKRIQVFDPDGRFLFQWGGGGALEGYLDEPVGVAVGPDGAIYVADTWNRRVQVFDTSGAFLRQWPIAGWDAGLSEEKPYLAVDAQGYVYVTDPGYYRLLVFDSQGNYVLSFGRYGPDDGSFALPMGVAVADDGSIYVSDAHGNRVFIFDPLDLE